MTIEDRGRTAGLRTVATFESSTNVALDFDRLVDRRRSQRRNRTVAFVACVVVAVFAVFVVQSNLSANSQPQPMEPVPGIDVGDVPVWYDEAGLHRGNVVEPTPIELLKRTGEDSWGALALVRTGAVYLDPVTREVWFHPWGGEPRIVGHNSIEGPGGDPNGDTAAWFEGSELVIYDTITGGEISRTRVSPPPSRCQTFCVEHIRGNGFLQVSAERVVWAGGSWLVPIAYDVRTGDDSVIKGRLLDVHDDAALYWGEQVPGGGVPGSLIVSIPGQEDVRYPELAHRGRFSATGAYVLSVYDDEVEKSGAAILDIRSGEVWHVPDSGWPWLSWSYGDIALVEAEIWSSGGYRPGELLACDAARRTCETLPAVRPFLMPTN